LESSFGKRKGEGSGRPGRKQKLRKKRKIKIHYLRRGGIRARRSGGFAKGSTKRTSLKRYKDSEEEEWNVNETTGEEKLKRTVQEILFH